jgi:DNA-binding response OmpR family regulator
VSVGDATIDLRQRTVTAGDATHELTAREFGLLDLLLKHRGEVLNRSLILDRVWGVSHDPTTNVVDVYVGYLRNKLDTGDTSVIETVRGRGYRLRPEDELDAT